MRMVFELGRGPFRRFRPSEAGCSFLRSAIFPVWGIPYGDAVAATLTAIAALIGVTIGVSEIKARIK